MADDIREAENGENRIGRLTENWVYGALPIALLLILFAPFVNGIALPVYLSLPI
ncbi:hypothetical protein K1W69_22055 [Hoeflea sp. WL0058]|uniref:Uncharacterized protein n=1 Tax=Flavimaribacter sediminis TaxID=2865987 RepID=A0AAE2ZSC7_9HYPH|nr:hypothetical protein [Flavimaribacter sediminis]MBW8639895.1 hypothetical protein [Flavimaribacter sediminis]